MAAVLASAIGLGLYALAVNEGLALAIVLVVILALGCVLSVIVGSALGHTNPSRSSLLIQPWSLLVLLVAGAAVGGGIYAGTEFAGDDATGSEKVIIVQVGTLFGALVLYVRGVLEKHLAPWFSYELFKRKYASHFPSAPADSTSAGYKAWDTYWKGAKSYDEKAWTRESLRAYLVTMAQAIKAGQFSGGDHWTPRPAASVQPSLQQRTKS